MHRSEGVNVAAAAILLGIGAVILGLLAPIAAAIVAGVCIVAGLYVLGGIYVGWWLPTTAVERLFRPNLRDLEASIVKVSDPQVILRVGLYNAGRDNVPDAILNVVVPEFITEIHRCAEDGEIGREEHKGTFSRTPEPLIQDQPKLHSIYWNGNVSYPGRTHRVAYFRVTMPETRDFPVRLEITAPGLEEPFHARFELSPETFRQQLVERSIERAQDSGGRGS